ncbi:MAG: glutamate synthase subunit alpha, partial [Bacillus sp. (in: firmicutes)]
LSGGKIIVRPSRKATFVWENNIIVGNVSFYGATAGEAYISGIAGERFCVRNSGANVVVEGVGDHGCEYMTGGKVIVLGTTGRNFAAGMSGGVAYVLDVTKDFRVKCNQEQVYLDSIQDETELQTVYQLIENHVRYTHSPYGMRVLDSWADMSEKFVRVIPKDYLEMQERIRTLREGGLSEPQAALLAFEESKKAVNSMKDGG